jgi:hypothetical protein
VRVRDLTLIAFAWLWLGGCAGPQVRSLGTGGGAPAYQMRGQNLPAIESEAARLCVKGYDLLRQSQSYARPEPDDNAGTQWLQQAGEWLAGMPGNQAQATVVCRA